MLGPFLNFLTTASILLPRRRNRLIFLTLEDEHLCGVSCLHDKYLLGFVHFDLVEPDDGVVGRVGARVIAAGAAA